jgi:hypothetical protein
MMETERRKSAATSPSSLLAVSSKQSVAGALMIHLYAADKGAYPYNHPVASVTTSQYRWLSLHALSLSVFSRIHGSASVS